jgi:hypothetical protein
MEEDPRPPFFGIVLNHAPETMRLAWATVLTPEERRGEPYT